MTPLDEVEYRAQFLTLDSDERSRDARKAACAALAPALRAAGRLLWYGGSVFGGDRVAGRSPFGFGSDATVGLATVTQIAGELCAGTLSLLEVENRYAAGALLRQLVEVEYLAWAFAEDEEEAARWMRSTKDERMKMWQPRHIRERSAGRFRASDYGEHCERGGHPTPDVRPLLPDHEQAPSSLIWLELAIHGVSAWEYIEAGIVRLEYGDAFRGGVPEVQALRSEIDAWRSTDKVRALVAAHRKPDVSRG